MAQMNTTSSTDSFTGTKMKINITTNVTRELVLRVILSGDDTVSKAMEDIQGKLRELNSDLCEIPSQRIRVKYLYILKGRILLFADYKLSDVVESSDELFVEVDDINPDSHETLVAISTSATSSTAIDTIDKGIDVSNKKVGHNGQLISIQYQTISGAVQCLAPRSVMINSDSSLKILKHAIAADMGVLLAEVTQITNSVSKNEATIQVSIGVETLAEVKISSLMTLMELKQSIVHSLRLSASFAEIPFVVPEASDMHYIYLQGNDYSQCETVIPILRDITSGAHADISKLVLAIHGPHCLSVDCLSNWNIFVTAPTGTKMNGKT